MTPRLLNLAAVLVAALPAAAAAQSGPIPGCPAQLKACTSADDDGGNAVTPGQAGPRMVQDQGAVPFPGGGGRQGRGMARMDTNGDGVITLNEWLSGRARLFQRLDTNGDGVVGRDEVSAMASARRAGGRRASPERLFQRIDANGDGVVDGDEFDSAGRTMFGRLDRNGDGVLSAEELPHGRQAR